MTLVTKTEAKRDIDKAQSISRFNASNSAEIVRFLKDNKQCVVLIVRQST